MESYALLPKDDRYVGNMLPETASVHDEVYLSSSNARLVGDQVSRFLLEPGVSDNKLISNFKLLYSLTLSVPFSYGLSAMHLLDPRGFGSDVPVQISTDNQLF